MAKKAKKAKKLSKKDRRTLSGHLVVSRDFRTAFLKNPKKAARSIGIKLSGAVEEEAKRYIKELRGAADAGMKAVRKKIMQPLGGRIPSFILD